MSSRITGRPDSELPSTLGGMSRAEALVFWVALERDAAPKSLWGSPHRATVCHKCGNGGPIVERREVHFSGMVQGVGFRYTTQRIAANYRVTGYVQNLPDGRVYLVAEGDPQELDRFIADIYHQMGDFIDSAETHRAPATGQFQRFFIKH